MLAMSMTDGCPELAGVGLPTGVPLVGGDGDAPTGAVAVGAAVGSSLPLPHPVTARVNMRLDMSAAVFHPNLIRITVTAPPHSIPDVVPSR
jgi:hypothetical protein